MREIEDQLAGRVAVTQTDTRTLRSTIEVFVADKRVENLTADLVRKYERKLGRFATFCEGRKVYTVAGVNREPITRFREDWSTRYPSANTRNKLSERYKAFLKFCRVAGWTPDVPAWPKMVAEQVPTFRTASGPFRRRPITRAIRTITF